MTMVQDAQGRNLYVTGESPSPAPSLPNPPVKASGFGTNHVITGTNPYAFSINVGTGGTATGGVITLPPNAGGYACVVNERVVQALGRTVCSANSSTSVTLTNYTLSTGVALAWPSAYVLDVHVAPM